jgi:hypothetical protein
MPGGDTQRTRNAGQRGITVGELTTATRQAEPRVDGRRPLLPRHVGSFSEPRRTRGEEDRGADRAGVYLRRRAMAVCLLLLGVVALVFAVFVQSSGATEGALPIDPSNAGPDAVLAEAAGVEISTPIRPASLTGLGYHPEGETLVEMSPRGRNLSANPILGLFTGGSTPEDIRYHLMDPAERPGPRTGALDVGAEAGTTVYAPVTGVITAIRPDPTIQGANVVEIEPADNPNLRVSVSLVRNISAGIGPDSPVTAGMTELGAVADSAEVLEPQLSSYTTDAGNHVTVSVSTVG